MTGEEVFLSQGRGRAWFGRHRISLVFQVATDCRSKELALPTTTTTMRMMVVLQSVLLRCITFVDQQGYSGAVVTHEDTLCPVTDKALTVKAQRCVVSFASIETSFGSCFVSLILHCPTIALTNVGIERSCMPLLALANKANVIIEPCAADWSAHKHQFSKSELMASQRINWHSPSSVGQNGDNIENHVTKVIGIAASEELSRS